MSGSERERGALTVPNALSVVRLAGIVPLVWVARAEHRLLFLGVMVALLLTDWLDGKLAVLLGQRTELGARLDSAADAAMYSAIAVCYWWLEGDVMSREMPWFLTVGVTWMVSVMVAMARFGRMPSYHSWGAKASWLAVSVTAVHWLLTGSGLLVPWALALVILTNVEATAIGLALPRWRADVPTLWHALRQPAGGDETTGEGSA